MTISTEPTALSYAGDGATLTFAITWKYFAKAHVVVTHRDTSAVETTWVLGTQYTLSDAGVSTGGTLTVSAAPTDYTPATGETLVIELSPSNTQDSDLPIGGPFPSQSVEDELDEAAQRDAKLETLLNRAMLVPKTDTQSGSQLNIPIDSTRANKILGFDSAGKPSMFAPTDASADAVTATVTVDTVTTVIVATLKEHFETIYTEVRGTKTFIELTDAATVAVDMSLGVNFYVTVTADRTIGAPSSVPNGQAGMMVVEQDGSGGHTTSWNAAWNWGTDSAPVPDETAGAKAMIAYQVDWDDVIYAKFIDDIIP